LAAVVWRVFFFGWNDAFHHFSLLYFSLIHFNYYVFSLIMPLRCRQTWYSWSYGYLNLSLPQKIECAWFAGCMLHDDSNRMNCKSSNAYVICMWIYLLSSYCTSMNPSKRSNSLHKSLLFCIMLLTVVDCWRLTLRCRSTFGFTTRQRIKAGSIRNMISTDSNASV
jgi:hypothetical protein